MTSCPEAMDWGFWVIFEKPVSWDFNLEEASWFSNVDEASPDMGYGMPARGGVRWNSQHSGNYVSLSLSLSPRVENLKVKKVIKVSYLNYRESSVFRMFRDSHAYERFTHLYISHIRIWLRYTSSCGSNSTTTVLQGRLRHKLTHKGWYVIKQSNQSNRNAEDLIILASQWLARKAVLDIYIYIMPMKEK